MITRQAIRAIITIFLLITYTACAASNEMPATPTAIPATATPVVTSAPDPVTPTPTPLTCLTAPGRAQENVVATTKPPQKFIIYTPPCYEYSTERYPVLYLLHGQTYTEDQWLRIGAATTADKLIHNDVAMPFIMVFPDDHYWNAPAGAEFGIRLVNDLIPYVDANYRTRADRNYRALGGLSRGGGWTAKVGFEHPDLFGILGFHSPALFKDNAPYLEDIIKNIPEEDRPKLWHDIGEADTELGSSLLFEEVLIRSDYIHEFHRFTGDHTERYWSAHVEEYLRWYAQIWQKNSAEQ